MDNHVGTFAVVIQKLILTTQVVFVYFNFWSLFHKLLNEYILSNLII